MINCPNCNELLGDNVDQCPECRHVITMEERQRISEYISYAQEEENIRLMAEHSRRIKLEIIITLLVILLAMGGTLLLMLYTENKVFVGIWEVVILAGYLFAYFGLRIGHCPFCERSLGRGSLFYTHCPRCGKRLR